MANTGIYLVTQLLNDKFRAEGFKTITFGDISEKDLNKQTVFPFMHIALTERVFNDSTEVVTCSLSWLDIIYKEKDGDQRTTPDKFSNITNTEDIFHDLGYRVNRAYQQFRNDLDNTIEVPDSLTLTAMLGVGQNELAGYEASFPITIIGGDICDV